MGAGQNDSDLLRQQINIIQQRVTVSNEVIHFFKQFANFNERRLRKVVGTAVDNSIVEILPPVVDRSVTIALITTRELVLKDFAYDGDNIKVVKASDLIIQNLAGSLALVTCREPLRMSLNTNLKKIFEEYIIDELKVEITKSSFT
jgi:CCR4-NOT transcription complex subunit 1